MSGKRVTSAPGASIEQFTMIAEAVSEKVIRSYSTSFGLATRLLGTRHRRHVRNIYALVRVADEIVDGVASQAGLSIAEQKDALDEYVERTHLALRTGYSSDLVVHAFARTSRQAGIDEDLTTPFFASMRADLVDADEDHVVFDRTKHAAYVYGSAEVVGLMCLRVFTRDSILTDAERHTLEHGARRLGAAFQNINFLRDLGDDTARLGRSYLGTGKALSDEDLRFWIAEIRSQLSDAAQAIPLLPYDARAAVRSALGLFTNLTKRIARTPASELSDTRIRVPNPIKAALVCSAIFRTLAERRR